MLLGQNQKQTKKIHSPKNQKFMEEETNKEVETITENTTSVTGTQSENANNAENNPKVDKKATLYTIKVLLFLLRI